MSRALMHKHFSKKGKPNWRVKHIRFERIGNRLYEHLLHTTKGKRRVFVGFFKKKEESVNQES